MTAMMQQARGRHAKLFGFRDQSAFDTPATGTYVRKRFYTHSLEERQGVQTDDALGAGMLNDREGASFFEELASCEGEMEGPLCLNQVGWDLAWAFGAPVTTGTADYEHVFQSGGEDLPLRTLVFQRLKDSADNPYRQFVGAGVRSFGMNVAKESGVQRVTLGVIAGAENKLAAAPASIAAELEYTPMSRYLGTALWNDVQVGTLIGSQATYNQGLEGLNFATGDARIGAIAANGASVDGNFTVRYVDDTWHDIGEAKEEGKLSLLWALGATKSLRLDFNHVRIPRRGAPIDGPDGWDAQFDIATRQGDTLPILTATLKNQTASYAMPSGV